MFQSKLRFKFTGESKWRNATLVSFKSVGVLGGDNGINTTDSEVITILDDDEGTYYTLEHKNNYWFGINDYNTPVISIEARMEEKNDTIHSNYLSSSCVSLAADVLAAALVEKAKASKELKTQKEVFTFLSKSNPHWVGEEVGDFVYLLLHKLSRECGVDTDQSEQEETRNPLFRAYYENH